MTDRSPLRQKNRRTLLLLSGLVVGMFGFAFALVPLYNLICEITGIQSIALRSESAVTVSAPVVAEAERSERTLKVKLDTSIHPDLPWQMELQQPVVMEVRTGEVYEVVFRARNRSNQAVTAQAIPSVTPWQATPYFNKLECFCFNRQTLAGGEQTEMPLRFVVSPKLPSEVNSITLSYSVMRLEGSSLAQVLPDAGGSVNQ